MAAILCNGGSSDKLLPPTEAAYLAGFFDGEGCFTIGRAKRAEHRSGVTYFAVMTAANTDLQVLIDIMGMCGNGKIQLSDKRRAVGHKTLYRIMFGANQIRHVLPQIRKYLRVKGKQADVLMEFLGAKVAGKNMTPELWQKFEQLRSEIRTLNVRGIKDTSAEQINIRAHAGIPSLRKHRACEYAGCERKHFAKGYCFMHYRKFVLRGGPKQYVKSCAQCGAEFAALRSDRVCCSKACADKRYYALHSEKVKASVAKSRRGKSAVGLPATT